ncbi:hypothetical protein [Streptomyces sp. NPDC029041]
MLWPAPWYLTGLSMPLWAVLRAREEATHQPDEDDDSPSRWEEAA